MKSSHARYLPVLIIGIAMFLRLWLGLVNREANDNHVDVVKLILKNHELPEKEDCWSCFQPKLFYIISAGVIDALNYTKYDRRVVAMQMLNVCISFFILLLFWKFIARQNLSAKGKFLLLALFAFNPCLAGINVQHTNDTLAIFCGVMAAYAGFRMFGSNSARWGIVLVIALIAGALTKASMLVMAGATAVAIVIKILAEPAAAKKRKIAGNLLVGTSAFILVVLFAGGYYDNYTKYGSLTLSTWEKDPPPHFFKKTPVERNGVESVAAGFFTFRYFDLVQHPVITNDLDKYPKHRTSLWSQVYGRTMFMHFDHWPPSWQSDKPFILWIGRLLLLLGIVPLLLFLAGICANAIKFVKNIFRWNRDYFAEPQNYFYLLVTLAFLASSVFYSYTYRDFSAMKSIYIFPGLLAFLKMTVDGYALLTPGWLVRVANVALVGVILLSITDIIFLMHQLRLNSPWEL